MLDYQNKKSISTTFKILGSTINANRSASVKQTDEWIFDINPSEKLSMLSSEFFNKYQKLIR